ncbi:hypothetical protein [Vitreimonas sp.]|uniref:hypothetical protein n=1 Tax=Vitreimonas sp. TaxID=3069702 RepID=UPI002ED9E220
MAGLTAQTRPRTAWVRYLGVLAALAPAPASAGAWIAPEGGQEIWSNVLGERDEVSFFETSAYWEMPFGEQMSFVAAPWVEQNYDSQDGWRAEATLSLKQALFRGDEWAVAVQAGALWNSHPALNQCGEAGAELRFLVGSSLPAEGAFVNLEAATRALEGGCESERFDFTAGYRPSHDWLLMGQVFLEAAREGDEAVKAQFTLVRFGDSGRGIQFGLRNRIDGGARETALVIGLWGAPGD